MTHGFMGYLGLSKNEVYPVYPNYGQWIGKMDDNPLDFWGLLSDKPTFPIFWSFLTGSKFWESDSLIQILPFTISLREILQFWAVIRVDPAWHVDVFWLENLRTVVFGIHMVSELGLGSLWGNFWIQIDALTALNIDGF